MKTFAVSKLAEILGAEKVADRGIAFKGVTIDSRSVKPGDCFVAIKGANHDGHAFVEQCLTNGAVCAVVEKNFKPKGNITAPLIRVDDTVKALGKLANAYRKELNCKIIGITGSAGKTTTRQIIHHVLSKKYKVHTAIKSYNNNIGLPLTILGIEPEHEIAVVEMGTNHPGEIIELTMIAEPDVAVITNVYEAHIENFGSIEAIQEEKTMIIKGLRNGGPLYINQDSPGLEEFCKMKNIQCRTFGKTSRAEISARDIKLQGFASSFEIDGIKIEVPLAGKGNIDNAIAAYAACSSVGITAAEFAAGIKDLGGVSMRLEPIKLGRAMLICDCYNANPASMANALDLLGHIDHESNRRKVFICGPMLELGEHGPRAHAELGEKAAHAGVGLLLATGPLAQTVTDSAKQAAITEIQTQCFDNTASIAGNILKPRSASITAYLIRLLPGLSARPLSAYLLFPL